MTQNGIDISRWQGTMDWAAVKQAGVTFSIARATIGLGTDATYPTHTEGAIKAGLTAGAYHYLVAGDPVAQADHFLDVTDRCHGILAALDCEDQGLTAAGIKAFSDRFDAGSGGHPLFIYTGLSFWKVHGNPPIDLLWLAYYPGGGYPGDADPIWNRRVGGVTPTIWQYGPRPIKGRPAVDGDAFRGTRAELDAFTGALTGGGNQPGGDMSISTRGLELTSDYAVNLPTGTLIYDQPVGGAKVLGKASGPVPYFGIPAAGWKAVRCDPDGTGSRIAYTTTAASTYAVPPPPAPDCSAVQAQLDTALTTIRDREDRLRRSSAITTF